MNPHSFFRIYGITSRTMRSRHFVFLFGKVSSGEEEDKREKIIIFFPELISFFESEIVLLVTRNKQA